MFVVTIYDVTDDKRRYNLHRKMKNFAEPVQYSAFEAHLKPKQLKRMEDTIKEIIKKSEDRVRIYLLCQECLSRTIVIGEGQLTEDPHTIILSETKPTSIRLKK